MTRDSSPSQAQMTLGLSPATPPIPDRIGDATVESSEARSILTPQKGRVSFVGQYDYTINPYQGCTAACDYCYPAAYNQDPELSRNWGLWVKVKSNAPEVIQRERRLLDGARIYMASVTDPYQPVERHADVTGRILDIMSRHTPLLVLQTRFPLVIRDIPRLQAIVANGGMIQVNITVTTDDDHIRRELEPKCPSIPARINALAKIANANLTACATITPMLPVSDPLELASRLHDAGVRKVIIQDFHTDAGSGQQFRRSIRPAALEWLTQNWGQDWRSRYNAQYRDTIAAMQQRFPGNVGIGQDGFRPPF